MAFTPVLYPVLEALPFWSALEAMGDRITGCRRALFISIFHPLSPRGTGNTSVLHFKTQGVKAAVAVHGRVIHFPGGGVVNEKIMHFPLSF